MESEVTHGLYATYTNMKCRCPECKQAAAEYMRGYRRTSTGKSHARLHQIVANKRSQIAVQWIKEQHPDRWANICQEALRSLEGNEKGNRQNGL